MKALTFRGGLHPNDRKDDTRDCAIADLEASQFMVYPMSQHIGAECTPLVKKGDSVLAGQKIGNSEAFVSAPVHSTVSGTVTAVEKRLHPNGRFVMSVVVENDFRYEVCPEVGEVDINTLSKDDMLSAIRNAGVVGLGGATFPTHIKLNPPPDKKIDCFIVNGAECEPYLTSDYRVMLENPDLVFMGIDIIKKILGVEKCYIGIENNKPKAIKIMSEYAAKYGSAEVKVLKTKYPQGSEKHLIKAITGREVPSGKLPADVGAVVDNIDTCTAVYNAVMLNRCIMTRVVTVAGSAVGKPSNLRVRVGTSFEDILKAADCDFENLKKVVMGGPMMGIAQTSLSVPTVKGTSAVLAFAEDETASRQSVNCVHCGACVAHCPMSLVPAMLNSYSKIGDFDRLKKLNIFDCIECGVCSYTCPCRNTITQNIKIAKAKIREGIQK